MSENPLAAPDPAVPVVASSSASGEGWQRRTRQERHPFGPEVPLNGHIWEGPDGLWALATGDGTGTTPWVVVIIRADLEGHEGDTPWPTFEELQDAAIAVTEPEGALFQITSPWVSAWGGGPGKLKYPTVLLQQRAAIPGSAAEGRLTISGGLGVRHG